MDWLEFWMQPHQEWHRGDGLYFPKMSAQQISGWIEDIRAGRNTVDRHVIRLDGRRVGTCTWWWEHEPDGWARCGVAVYDPAERGQGIGTEALVLLADVVFADTDAQRLDLGTWSGNEGMCGAARSAGFVEEARFGEARWFGAGATTRCISGCCATTGNVQRRGRVVTPERVVMPGRAVPDLPYDT